MANVAVNATISARDAASKNIKTVNAALGKLGNTAGKIGADFKKVALGIAGLAAGVGAFTASAIRDAAADQAATAKLNAALKARGLATDSVRAAVEKQIAAGQKLAFTDDEVRASIEGSTRFTKNYSQATKIQNVAMELARATGMDLATATLQVGKAYQGTGGKLLKTLGITGKVVKGQQALDAILGKTKGSAAAYADTVQGSFDVLAIGSAELKEQFGDIFLPAVAKLFKGLAPYIDRFSRLITKLTPKLSRMADQLVDKILSKLPMFMGQLESELPKVIIGVEQFIDKIAGIGREADKLLGPGGSITALVTGIGAAIGGLKGAIAANLLKAGIDPFTALIVANIAAEIPAALAAAITNALVTRAIGAFGAKMAASSAAGAAASAAGAAASGAGAAAGGGSLLALLGAAALPVTIVALSAAAVLAIANGTSGKTLAERAAESGNAPRPGQTSTTYKGPAIGPLPGNPGSFRPFAGITPMPGAPMIGATSTTVNNIFIGTGKVDTVVSDSIKRTGTFSRGR
jgi:hypothetical protein